MEVYVTQEDIKDAIAALKQLARWEGFSAICPLAQAIRRLGGFAKSADITVGSCTVGIDGTRLNLSAGLPDPLLTPDGWSEACSSAPFTVSVEGLENWL